MVAKQRAFIYQRLRETTQSTVRRSGLDLFRAGKRLSCVGEIPGVAEGDEPNAYRLQRNGSLVKSSGLWEHALQLGRGASERDRNMTQSRLSASFKLILEKLRDCSDSWPFREPVDADEVSEHRVCFIEIQDGDPSDAASGPGLLCADHKPSGS